MQIDKKYPFCMHFSEEGLNVVLDHKQGAVMTVYCIAGHNLYREVMEVDFSFLSQYTPNRVPLL